MDEAAKSNASWVHNWRGGGHKICNHFKTQSNQSDHPITCKTYQPRLARSRKRNAEQGTGSGITCLAKSNRGFVV